MIVNSQMIQFSIYHIIKCKYFIYFCHFYVYFEAPNLIILIRLCDLDYRLCVFSQTGS